MYLSSFIFIAAVSLGPLDGAAAFLGPQGFPSNRATATATATTNANTNTNGPLHVSRTKGPGSKKKQRSTQKAAPKKRSQTFVRREPRPRPLVTDYDENRNTRVNLLRLADGIGCEHFGECAGCSVDANVDNTDIIKSAKRFFSSTAVRKERMDVHSDNVVIESSDDGFYQVVVPSPLKAWRTQAKLAAGLRTTTWGRDGCRFGLYQRGTHKILPIPNCQVHHPSINQAIQILTQATAKVITPAFDHQSGEGGLRYVQCQVERTTGKVCLTLVWNAETLKQTQPALTRLVKEVQKIDPGLWHSIWVHCNNGQGNNIFSRAPGRWHHLIGPEFIREPIPVGDKGFLFFSPLCFRQGNMDGFDILATDVAKYIPGGSRVCELYAGVGLLGLTALSYHADSNPLQWVRCSDENPANLRSFTRSISSLPDHISGKNWNPRKQQKQFTLGDMMEMMESDKTYRDDNKEKITYEVASAASALLSGQALGADILVVDPPRRGLEDDVLMELCKPFNPNQEMVENKDFLNIPDHKVCWTNDVQTLIYVSCGFDALARDTEKLISSRAGWKLESATGYILFPGSDHVETVCVFKRR